MNDYIKERELQRKREYHRKWRAEHPDVVKAAQMRFWTKKAQELQLASATAGDTETRSTEE